MDPHGVKIFDGTDDYDVVSGIAHHLQLVLFPANDRFLHENLVGGGSVDAAQRHLFVFFHVIGDAATGPAQGKRGADDRRETDLLYNLHRFLEIVGKTGAGHIKADPLHRLLEQGAVFRHLDRRQFGADQFDAEFFEDTVFRHRDGGIQCSLSSQRRQNRVGPLLFNNLGENLRRHRFNIGTIGKVGIGHDGCRVAVEQHNLEPLLLQRLARLGSRVVELARLTDDDGAGADDENFFKVGTFGHYCSSLCHA